MYPQENTGVLRRKRVRRGERHLPTGAHVDKGENLCAEVRNICAEAKTRAQSFPPLGQARPMKALS